MSVVREGRNLLYQVELWSESVENLEDHKWEKQEMLHFPTNIVDQYDDQSVEE